MHDFIWTKIDCSKCIINARLLSLKSQLAELTSGGIEIIFVYIFCSSAKSTSYILAFTALKRLILCLLVLQIWNPSLLLYRALSEQPQHPCGQITSMQTSCTLASANCAVTVWAAALEMLSQFSKNTGQDLTLRASSKIDFKGPLLYCFSSIYYRSQIYTKHISEVFGSKHQTDHCSIP